MYKNKQTYNNQAYNKQLYSSCENLNAEPLIKVIGKSFHRFVAFDQKNLLLKDKLYRKMFAKLAGVLVWYELCHPNSIVDSTNRDCV